MLGRKFRRGQQRFGRKGWDADPCLDLTPLARFWQLAHCV
jgi:hypothetical protein